MNGSRGREKGLKRRTNLHSMLIRITKTLDISFVIDARPVVSVDN